MDTKELNDLKNAVKLLENPSLGAKITDIMGTPIEKAIALLPGKAADAIRTATKKAIHGALKLALKTMDHHEPGPESSPPEASTGWHKLAVAATGAGGGAFGLLALTIELPVSTTIMMRSIADVARSEGTDLREIESQLECVQVLALGGNSRNDDVAEAGYFVARKALTKAVSEAAAHIAKNGLQKESAPAIIRFILQIAERYSINVTEKVAAQLVPVVGGIGGALINTMFIDHFQNMARGHFTVRRLERKHGPEIVQQKYLEFKQTSL